MIHLVFDKIWFSLWQSLTTAGLCLIIGGGLALLEHHFRVKTSKLFNSLMVLPIFLPSLIVATGFIVIWGNAGVVNQILAVVGIGKIKFLYSPWAIIAAHCFYNIPLAYLAISSGLSNVHVYLEETASSLGANTKQVFKLVVWPRIKKSCLGVGTIIFLYSFLSFAIPLILGGVRYQTLEVYIYYLATQQLDFDQALGLAGLQFIFLFIMVLFFIKSLKSVSEKKIKNNNYNKNYKISLTRAVIALYIFMPLAGLLAKGLGSFDVHQVIAAGFIAAWLRSFMLASISLALVMVISLWLVFKNNNYGKYIILFLTISPVMIGLTLLLLLGKSLLLMPLAYSIMLLPLAYYLLSSSWQSRPTFFDDTLKILGTNKFAKIKSQVLYLFPAIIKVAALSYAFVLGDITIAALLSPFNKPTAISLGYSLLGSYRFTLASSIMSLVLISIFVLITIIYLTTKKYDFEN